MSALEWAGVVTGILGVWLLTRENVWGWAAMLASAAAYIAVFFEARLYAGMGLQVVYVVLFVEGGYRWLHGGSERGALAVSRTPERWRWGLLAAGTAATALLGYFLRRSTDESLPFWDSAATSFSLIAQWMQTRKWLENWLVWIIVDLIYVGMCLHRRLLPTTALYATLIALATVGLVQWKRSMAARGVAEE